MDEGHQQDNVPGGSTTDGRPTSVTTFHYGQGILGGHLSSTSVDVYSGCTVTSTNPISGDTVTRNAEDPDPTYSGSKQRLNIQEYPGYAADNEEQLNNCG